MAVYAFQLAIAAVAVWLLQWLAAAARRLLQLKCRTETTIMLYFPLDTFGLRCAFPFRSPQQQQPFLAYARLFPDWLLVCARTKHSFFKYCFLLAHTFTFFAFFS